jgi:hypothetical protein
MLTIVAKTVAKPSLWEKHPIPEIERGWIEFVLSLNHTYEVFETS